MGPLPTGLPIVVYYGTGEWKAEEEVAGLCAAPGAPYQPSQRHLVLDVGRYIGPFAEERNWMADLVRLARAPDPEVVTTELRDVSARWPESEYDNLLKDILTWLGQVHFPMHNIKLKIPELADARETINMLHQVGMDWSAKLRAEGQAEGRAEGQTALMRRQVARKFGLETAERLTGRLEEITDPERTAEIGEWLLECDSGEELLARVARLCESPATGNGAPPG